MVSKRDKYKRFISFGSAVVLLAALSGSFAFIWYRYYSDTIVLPYYRRGNWVLIGIYALLVWLFFKAYGGFKIGYLKKTDMLYSQMISMVCVNVVGYFMVSLIGRDFMRVSPFLLLTAVDFAFIFVWTLVAAKLYFMIYHEIKLCSNKRPDENKCEIHRSQQQERTDSHEVTSDKAYHEISHHIDAYHRYHL